MGEKSVARFAHKMSLTPAHWRRAREPIVERGRRGRAEQREGGAQHGKRVTEQAYSIFRMEMLFCL